MICGYLRLYRVLGDLQPIRRVHDTILNATEVGLQLHSIQAAILGGLNNIFFNNLSLKRQDVREVLLQTRHQEILSDSYSINLGGQI
jgi:hypothetical protein